MVNWRKVLLEVENRNNRVVDIELVIEELEEVIV